MLPGTAMMCTLLNGFPNVTTLLQSCRWFRWPMSVAGLWCAGAMMADAATYPLPPEGDALIGKVQETRVQAGEPLLDIARRYGVGLTALETANPGIDSCRTRRRRRLLAQAGAARTG